mmetsp:Transcript_58643/g.169727  ORF Transcript_58643/g.169727 Transcript_58643/m.169727 type:complete len:248 (+) Transcript_58643:71-814(+)
MSSPRALLFAMCLLRVFRLSDASCGEGIGNWTGDEDREKQCRQCHGLSARLTFRSTAANATGITYCTASEPVGTCADSLEHDGNLTSDAELAKACKACLGEAATLQFAPADRVAGAGGRTRCVAADATGESSVAADAVASGPGYDPRGSRSTPSTLPLRLQCGEGKGDVRAAPSGEQMCARCEGYRAHLIVIFIPWDGALRTLCRSGGRRLRGVQGAAQQKGVGSAAEQQGVDSAPGSTASAAPMVV